MKCNGASDRPKTLEVNKLWARSAKKSFRVRELFGISLKIQNMKRKKKR